MPNFRERIAGVFAAASSTGVALRVTGDTQDRIVIDAGGRISWGSGSAAADATIERSSTNVVRITNGLVVDTAGGGAPSRTVVLKNSGQNSVAFGAFPWEWSTSLQLQSNDSSRWLWINAGSNDGAYNSRIRAGNTGLDIYVGGTSANNGTLGLTVTSAGSVGIGTASPAAKLQVVGNARIGQASNSSTSALLEITAGGSGFDSIIDLGYWDTFDAALWFLKRHGADGSFRIANVGTGSEVPVLTITNSNTVGVGTTAPGSNKMRVEGGYLSVNNAESGTGELRIGAVYSLPGIYADVASLALRINSGANSTGIELATNGNNVRLSINNSGVVSIPGSLSVTGGVTANLTGNASTATTLATARNINGTSFNGSADITTANWGTSRTITLGNTGKAVNGSGNVSWTITEIGAEERQVIGVPRFNLGTPSVREVAMFDTQNNNKTEFHPIASYFIETSTNGTTWTTLSGVTDTQKRQLVGGDTYANINIPYGTPFFRIRMRAVSYVSLEAFYSFWSGNGHSTSLQIFRKHDLDANWTQHTNSTVSSGAWPGHVYLPFNSIWWNASAVQGTHDHEVYALFTPTWNASFPSNGITLYLVQWWGGYPAAKRNVFSTDENRNVAFPGQLSATLLTSTAGANISGGDIGLGSGTQIDFADEVGDKSYWWSNTYGTGIESSTLTHWSADRHRFRIGGSSVSSGTEKVTINATGLRIGGGDATQPLDVVGNAAISGTLTVSTGITGTLTGNASTASTLAVSRNINGTAFNGSADITTANWGTARTLTVGNTGKSVNGGANVSWTISEIGAASKPELEAVLGDLMYVGTYNAATLGPNTKPTPTWSGGSTVYRHGMYWVVSSPGYVSYFTPDGVSGETDLATREPANATNQEVRPGDWIICQNPSYDPQSPNATFSVGSAIFRFLSFSAENYVARAIADHAADPSDPHSAAGYLTNFTGDQRYAKLIHNHASDIEQALINHRAEADPHTQYLTLVEGNAAYASLTHLHDDRYERLGAIAAHVALTDPHPQYLTPAEGDAAYAPVIHNHDLLYYTKTQVDSAIANVPREVFSSDGAQSSRLFIGSVQPASPAVGDLWIETANISLQPPPAPATLTAVAPSSTTVTISWAAWATSVSQSSVAVQRRNGSDWTTVTPDTIFTDASSPFDTSFTDTGRLEKTEYFYRVRAVNSAGNGEWGYVSIRTPNGAPGAPTSLTTSGITATQITLSWSAPSPFDGSGSGDNYEVFLNGVSRGFASGANTSFAFGSGAVGSSNPPLTERTTYTVGVRAKDAGDFNTGLNKLFSTIATTTAPTGNAAPPPPKSAAASGVTHNQATLNWAAGDPVVADGHPAGGISDLLRYRVYLNDVEITNTTNTSYTFTGLSPSTAYKLEARAEDTLNSLSTDNAAGSFVNITTSANPDTTPPLAPTITSFQPVTAYGRMQVAITWPSAADTNFGEVVYYPGSGAAAITWTTSVTPGASITRNFYDQNAITEAAGQTPRVAVRARDSSGNWSSVTEATYTLIASPYVVAADSSNSWRNESGGRYNATGNFRPVQGYFSNAALNATGLWYYGTKVADQIYNSGRRTVTNVEVYMRRNTGGSGSNQHVSIALHNELTNPGSVYTAGPTLYFPSPQTTPLQVTTGTGLAWNGGFEWCAITVAEWRAALVNGTNKGVAIRDADGVPYVILDSVAENGDSGRLRFTHLG